MNYHHFTIEERCCLREYYVKGKSYREIAKLLGRNVSSVSRELRRNCTFYRDVPRYYPYTAQRKSNLRNSYRHQGVFCDRKVLDLIVIVNLSCRHLRLYIVGFMKDIYVKATLRC